LTGWPPKRTVAPDLASGRPAQGRTLHRTSSGDVFAVFSVSLCLGGSIAGSHLWTRIRHSGRFGDLAVAGVARSGDPATARPTPPQRGARCACLCTHNKWFLSHIVDSEETYPNKRSPATRGTREIAINEISIMPTTARMPALSARRSLSKGQYARPRRNIMLHQRKAIAMKQKAQSKATRRVETLVS